METHYKDMGDHYLLTVLKCGLPMLHFVILAVVWAKGEDGKVRGMIVERGYEGFTTPETTNKWSLRASKTGELVLIT